MASSSTVSTRARPDPPPAGPELDDLGPESIDILCKALNVAQEGRRKEDVHDSIMEAITDITVNLLDPSFTTGKKYDDDVPDDLIGLAAVKALCRAKNLSDAGTCDAVCSGGWKGDGRSY
ncbi:hypothetical protein BJ508DRAFT_366917 [Ascobolus immersus RN42]|uniref:Uncharacterized protein n=1 Tax=Ascobolus immersus RN42 TaxID=1160509 RepID=A0A3N4HLV1_ASCIM|nr:hypothetical protein BJ508DRAFT_366917 [Ascobolus immersus RN42]